MGQIDGKFETFNLYISHNSEQNKYMLSSWKLWVILWYYTLQVGHITRKFAYATAVVRFVREGKSKPMILECAEIGYVSHVDAVNQHLMHSIAILRVSRCLVNRMKLLLERQRTRIATKNRIISTDRNILWMIVSFNSGDLSFVTIKVSWVHYLPSTFEAKLRDSSRPMTWAFGVHTYTSYTIIEPDED